MSDPELHEITLYRAKAEPELRRFSAWCYCSIRTTCGLRARKFVPPDFVRRKFAVPFQGSPKRFGWEVGCRGMERFQSEAFSGTAEGAE
jgi:hypothetical protein